MAIETRLLTIAELKDLYRLGKLNLNPPYQRRPVWKFNHRQLLLASVFNGMPMPAIILNRRNDQRKQYVYDVLDGKQRIETILQFLQLIESDDERELFVKKRIDDSEEIVVTIDDIRSNRFNKQYNNICEQFWKYRIPVIEYPGDILDFFGNPVPTMEVFVRINSTGSPLKANEIRHASSAGPFFKLGDDLEKKYTNRLTHEWKVFTPNDVQRYVLHEFIMELCTAIYFGKYTDKRKKLEDLLRNDKWNTKELDDIKRRFDAVMRWMRSIFTDSVFNASRFRSKSDFYSLFIVLNEFIDKGAVINNSKSNKILGNTLITFSKAVYSISPKLKKYNVEGNMKFSEGERELLRYTLATREGTDAIANREIRHKFLMDFIKGFVTETKDKKRRFDENVRGVLWTTLLQKSSNPKCPNPNNNTSCRKYLTLENAQVDHIFPWVKGGKTNLQNARLICDSCNKSKGSSI